MFKWMLVLCAVIWLCGVATVFADEPPTQPWDEDEIYDRLNRSTDVLSDSVFGRSQPVASNLQDIKRLAKSLSFNLLDPDYYEKGRVQDSREYLLGLSIDVWEIEQINAAVKKSGLPDPTRWSEQISDVRADLEAKDAFARHAEVVHRRHSHGSGGNDTYDYALDRVEVDVATCDKNGNAVQNCEVWFCLKGLVNYQSRFDHFDKPSSPTSRLLPPGNYVIWTRIGSAEGAQVALKDLGIDGQKSRAINIPAP